MNPHPVELFTDEQLTGALEQCRGVVSHAAMMLGVTSFRLSLELKKRTHILPLVDELRAVSQIDAIDKAEMVLDKALMQDEDLPTALKAAIYVLGTIGKSRGYGVDGYKPSVEAECMADKLIAMHPKELEIITKKGDEDE